MRLSANIEQETKLSAANEGVSSSLPANSAGLLLRIGWGARLDGGCFVRAAALLEAQMNLNSAHVAVKFSTSAKPDEAREAASQRRDWIQ